MGFREGLKLLFPQRPPTIASVLTLTGHSGGGTARFSAQGESGTMVSIRLWNRVFIQATSENKEHKQKIIVHVPNILNCISFQIFFFFSLIKSIFKLQTSGYQVELVCLFLMLTFLPESQGSEGGLSNFKQAGCSYCTLKYSSFPLIAVWELFTE